MIKTLTSILAWAALGGLLGAWLGAATGWGVFALGLLIMVLVSGWQLLRIARWVRDIDSPPPPSVGPWDDILAPIYRKLKQNRLDLQERTRNFQRALLAAEALPDGALTLDPEKSLLWCNQTAAAHLGLDLDRDRHHSILNIVRAPEFATYAQQQEWGRPLVLHLLRQGQARTLLLHLAPYGLGQYLMVTRDITQIERLENMRKDFVANVSHEMRTPLTVLSGFLETLHDADEGALDPARRRHYLALMLEQARSMQALVADLLTLSTLESSPKREGGRVPMPELIQAALTQGKALSGGHHVFAVEVDPDLAISGTQAELSSAVINLLSNAVRYTPEGGTITVSWTRTRSGGACYSVRDTGIGIGEGDLARLSERFFRVDRGRSRATGGTGLGLAITKHVAMRHDARLTMDSILGKGSTFSIDFPAKRVCPPQASAAVVAAAPDTAAAA